LGRPEFNFLLAGALKGIGHSGCLGLTFWLCLYGANQPAMESGIALRTPILVSPDLGLRLPVLPPRGFQKRPCIAQRGF
jgi:hypothetical protein